MLERLIYRSPGLGLTSSIVAAIEEDHISTEDHLARPPGWDALNYSQYDHIFEKVGYRIKRITTPLYVPSAYRHFKIPSPPTRTRSTFRYKHGPTELVVVRGNDYRVFTESQLSRKKNQVVGTCPDTLDAAAITISD